MTRIELDIPNVCSKYGSYDFNIYDSVYNREFNSVPIIHTLAAKTRHFLIHPHPMNTPCPPSRPRRR